MKYKTILFKKDTGLATITLHRPETLNALNRQVFSELQTVLAEIERDDAIKVVILTGGDKCFAAGVDIREIDEIATPAEARRFLKEANRVFDGMEELEKPIIAAISGLALGGGCELALACDLRIAADNATFGQPEIKIGVIAGGGGTQRLPRIIGITKAKELLYTGDFINSLKTPYGVSTFWNIADNCFDFSKQGINCGHIGASGDIAHERLGI